MADTDTRPLTPEEAHDRLIDGITYELEHYGLQSLLEMVATVLENYQHTEGPAEALHEYAYEQVTGAMTHPLTIKEEL